MSARLSLVQQIFLSANNERYEEELVYLEGLHGVANHCVNRRMEVITVQNLQIEL
jgi:hypothetical protein